MTVIGTHFATLIAALALLATSAPAAEPRIPQMFVGDWRIQREFENQTLALARCPLDTYDFAIRATKVDMVGDVLCDVVEPRRPTCCCNAISWQADAWSIDATQV
jgi:hypothetical protein